MSERRNRFALVATAVALAVASPATAQSLEQLRDRLRALDRQVAPPPPPRAKAALTRETRENDAKGASLQVGEAGGVMIVVLERSRPSLAQDLANRVQQRMTRFGVWPDSVLRRVAFVSNGPWSIELGGLVYRDSLPVAVASRVAGRFIVRFVPLLTTDTAGMRAVADDLARGVVAAVLARQSRWARWLTVLDPEWNAEDYNVGVVEELTTTLSTPGRRCALAEAAACADWLGLEDTPESLPRRFPAADIRRHLADRSGTGRDPLALQCGGGDDAACYRSMARVDPGPSASPQPRQAFIHYLRARFGPATVRAPLADSIGTLAARLERATGMETTQLAGDWRTWLFQEVRWRPVEAGLREIIPATGFVLLLLGLATRSGRCRE